MKRILPDRIYRGAPCSVCAVGCAAGITSSKAVKGLYSPDLRRDGYLSLDSMNRLIRANLAVKRRINFKRGSRPTLRDFCHMFSGRAVVCVAGHFVYVENGDYHSFFWNGGDEVIAVWEVSDGCR